MNQEHFDKVSQVGAALQNIPRKYQTKDLCLIAVKQYGLSLQYVKAQDEEICLAAVSQNGMALQFVKNQTKEICMTAVKENSNALQFVKEQDEAICEMAVSKWGKAIRFVKTQTEDLCLSALAENPKSFNYIKRPTKEVLDFAKQLGVEKKTVKKTFLNFLKQIFIDFNVEHIKKTEELHILDASGKIVKKVKKHSSFETIIR